MKKNIPLICIALLAPSLTNAQSHSEVQANWCEKISISGIVQKTTVTHPFNGSKIPVFTLILDKPLKIPAIRKPDCSFDAADISQVQLGSSSLSLEKRVGAPGTFTGTIYPPANAIEVRPAVLINAQESIPSTSRANDQNCKALSQMADKAGITISPPVSDAVTSKGRLYLHSAPNEKCRSKNLFVVNNDHVISYTEYDGWKFVMYLNEKTGVDSSGWVKAASLRTTGTVGLKN